MLNFIKLSVVRLFVVVSRCPSDDNSVVDIYEAKWVLVRSNLCLVLTKMAHQCNQLVQNHFKLNLIFVFQTLRCSLFRYGRSLQS
jgi:hypothetical protein